jgi:hypothetical protein
MEVFDEFWVDHDLSGGYSLERREQFVHVLDATLDRRPDSRFHKF